MNIGKIIQQAKQTRALSECEEAFIRKAYEFAKHVHHGQRRKTGEEYINHPLRAAYILASLGVDYVTIAAGLLHDVIEDTSTTKEELAKMFSKEVAILVDGVTKVKRVKFEETDYQMENLNKTLGAIAGDVRVAIIRLADRFDNMKSLEVHSQEKKERIATETLDIFSPIAERLGIGYLKGDLEDLSFYYLNSKAYIKLKAEADAHMKSKRRRLARLKSQLEEMLEDEGIKLIASDLRNKHYYSLFRKLERYDTDMDQIEDLVVIRLILPSINQCYQTLRVIHKNLKFIPGRIKDYIALPKANGYQALHTVVFDKLGGVIEIQIKTEQMHQRAKLGVIMNLDYLKQAGSKGDYCRNQHVQWLEHLKQWQQEANSLPSNDFIDVLKNDFLKNRIVVFDQRGNVYDLPEGSTIIDFSFITQGQRGIHTYKGKVNNEHKVLCHRLRNGDIIEVGFDKKIKLKPNMLRCIRTNIARKYLSSKRH